MTMLRQLRAWSGFTYRELTSRANAAGHALPHTTLASALARHTLPREGLLVAFVQACGLDQQALGRWVETLRGLRVAHEAAQPESTDSPDLEWLDDLDSGWSPPDRHRIGKDDVEGLAATTELLTSIDHRYGGYAVVDQAIGSHRRASRLVLADRSSSPYRRQFLSLLAVDAASAGISCGDAGRWQVGLSLNERALLLASSVDSAEAQVYALVDLASLIVSFCPPSRKLLHRAREAAEHASALAGSLGSWRVIGACALREARACAKLRDHAGYQRAMKRVMTAFDHGAGDDDPFWISWFTECALHAAIAKASDDLSYHSLSVHHSEKAIEIGDSYTRNSATRWMELAIHRASAGMPHQACRDAMTGLARHQRDVASELNRSLQRQLLAVLSRYDTPPVHDLRDHIRSQPFAGFPPTTWRT